MISHMKFLERSLWLDAASFSLASLMLAFAFMLFPLAERSPFDWPIYWSEGVIGCALLLAWWQKRCDLQRSVWGIFTDERIFFFFLCLFLCGVFIATLWASHTWSSYGNLKSFYAVPALFFALILIFGSSVERLRRMFVFWLMGIIAASLAALGAAALGWLQYDGRLSGPYTSANYLAMLIAPGIPIALSFFRTAISSAERWWYGFGLMLLVITIGLTHSYAAILAATVAVAVMTMPGRRPQLILTSLMVLGTLALAFFAFEHGSAKWESLVSGDERSSLASRMMIWRAAGEITKDSFPLGIGTGQFQATYLAYQPSFPPYLEWAVPTPHNLYLHFLLEGGILTLIGWLGCVGLLLWRAGKFFIATHKEDDQYHVVTLGMALVALYLVYGLIDTPYMKNDLALAVWGSFGLLLAALRLK